MPKDLTVTLKALTILLLCCCVTVPYSAIAQSVFDLGERHFHQLDQSEHLPGRIVTSMAQDQSGYLWFGTQQGLARFDGDKFKIFKYAPENPSIGGDDIRALWLDKQDQIWIGTFSDGLSVLSADRQSFHHYRHQPDNAISLSDDWVRSIVGDDTGRVWVGTDRGLHMIDARTEELIRITSIDGCEQHTEGIRELLLFNEQLWIAGKQGVCIVATDSQQQQRATLSGVPLSAMNEIEVVSLMPDSKQRVWLGTRQQGAFYVDQTGTAQAVPYTQNTTQINTLWVSDMAQVQHEIWLGTAGGGLIILDIETGQVLQHLEHDPALASSIRMNDISVMLQDVSGLLWIGTWGDGISRYNPVNDAFRSIRRGSKEQPLLTHKDVQSILVTQSNEIWLGTRGGGIDVLKPGIGRANYFQDIAGKQGIFGNDHITELVQTNDGSIWLGTRQQGLWHYSFNTGEFKKISDTQGLDARHIISLISGPDGRLWIGSENGIYVLSPGDNEVEKVSTILNAPNEFDLSVWAMAISATGRLWVGTSEGLYSIPTNKNHLVRMDTGLSDDAKLSNKSIVDLLVDRYGLLWVSTVSGLDRLHSWQGEQPVFESIKHKVGLPEQTNWGTLFQDAYGRIWSEQFVIDTKYWRAHRLLAEDGWDIGNQWHGTVTSAPDGIFLLGGTEGVLLVDPSRFQPWQYSPPLLINDIKINGQIQKTGAHSAMHLPPNTLSITIEPVVLDYLRPQSIRYRYRLLGFDENWVALSANNRTINFTNLDTGKYQLEIQATNSVGLWQPGALNMTLEQLPAWYQTILFKVGLVFSLLFIFFVTYRWRILQLERQKSALDNLVQQRTKDIVSLGNIGQEITASLSLAEIAQQVYSHVRELMGADTFLLGILDKDHTHIKIKFIIEKGEPIPEKSVSMGDLNRAAVWCISNKKALHTNQTNDLLNYLDVVQMPLSGEQSESIIYLPLIIENRVLGCLSVQSHNKHAFDDNQLQMLKTIASYTAIALDNANTHQQLTDTLGELQNKNDALASALQEIEKISLVDQLTGANNRRFLEKFLPAEISKLRRNQQKNPDERIGFLLLDADHFKQVNDTYGHEAGDQVLIQIVANLREVCRDSDWIVRLGGEEFLVIARFEQADTIEVLAERIRSKMAEHEFDIGDGQRIHKTCSIGTCNYPFFASQPEALRWTDILNLADKGLYAAKNHGRNGWVNIKTGDSPDIAYFQANFQNLDEVLARNIVTINKSDTLPDRIEFDLTKDS
ncbi:MAG: diguanylate cyclase [Aestuariibacter sp.]